MKPVYLDKNGVENGAWAMGNFPYILGKNLVMFCIFRKIIV